MVSNWVWVMRFSRCGIRTWRRRAVEEPGEPSDEVVDVRDVGEDAVGHCQIGLPALGDEFIRQADAEEVLHDVQLQSAGGGSGTDGFHADAWYAPGLDVLRQIAVVGGDPTTRLASVNEPVHHRGDIALGMGQPVLE
jgi:hypothetical protein